MTKVDTLCIDVEKKHRTLNSWKKVGDEYGISKALAWKIAHGHVPTKQRIRTALGLSPLVQVSTTADIPAGVRLPETARVVRCASCGTQFIRTANRQIYCRKECRK